jgi:hypothetical protein
MIFRSVTIALLMTLPSFTTLEASTIDSDGGRPRNWIVYHSVDFGIDVLLPGEARLGAPGGDQGNGRGNRQFVSAFGPDLGTMVMRIDFPQGAGFDDAQVRASLDAALDGGAARAPTKELEQRRDVTLEGYIGREMTMLIGPEPSAKFAVFRAYYVPDYIFCIMVISPSKVHSGPLFDQSLNSLKFLGAKREPQHGRSPN